MIGAGAIACHLDFRWRRTFDLDLSVAARPEIYSEELERLGWHRRRGSQHEWDVPRGPHVDVLPADPVLVKNGKFTWADGSARLTLVGFRLAFSDAVSMEIGKDAQVQVASLRSLVVLKMAAYLDRPHERDTDLGDLAYVIHDFLKNDSEERWTDEIIKMGMDFEDVGPFVLGRQLRMVVDEMVLTLVERFLSTIDNPDDSLATLHRMASQAPPSWKNPDRLRSSIQFFRRGLTRAP